VTNWSVETTSARALTTDLFKRQADNPALSRSEALRPTMLGLVDGPGMLDAAGRTAFSYAHPIFWAPFSLVGDGDEICNSARHDLGSGAISAGGRL
jgi:CHAT domain-containing protein